MKSDIDEFLRPLRIDDDTVHQLSLELCQTFKKLAAESLTQFLPTPVSESILRPTAGSGNGRYLAIDIGGSNLRVGFVQLHGQDSTLHGGAGNGLAGFPATAQPPLSLQERKWPILDHLKNENADQLFAWIGKCIAEVVQKDGENLPRDVAVPLGVTFSFPMVQHSLSEAVLMAMGKGFAITSDLDLGSQLIKGYEAAKSADLPPIRVAAIANDAVSTLVSFVYQLQGSPRRKAAMGLICGTGTNATIPVPVKSLHPDKCPRKAKSLNGAWEETVVAVNTEWSINGTAPALHKFGLVTAWDAHLDSKGEAPGFQPLEYMTAGRYLGELGRLVLLDWLTTRSNVPVDDLPEKLTQRFGITTTFLSFFKSPDVQVLVAKLENEFPTSPNSGFRWTAELAEVLYVITKTIEVRAAGITAAATVGLLAFAGDIPLRSVAQGGEREHLGANGEQNPFELVVGYTGGCIAHFQDYLTDCQGFLEKVMEAEFGTSPPVKIVLSPCDDGGITGAGIMCSAAHT